MIKSVQKATTLLTILADHYGTPISLAELALRANINKSTCAHLIATLEEEGFAVGDWWSAHDHILRRKRYFDMTGNNVNHPNDFLARLMAQTVVATVLE